jgi:hypothetical protein
MSSDPGALAADLLRALRVDDQDTARTAAAALAALTEDELAAGLPADEARIAFWVDLYNAAVVQQPADATATRSGRLRLFRRPVIEVAGHRLSLDAIEHGLLRRSSWKLGLGYLRNPRPSAFERRHRVERIDARIHFALNCGARSCPPIAAYQAEHIDDQLDRAVRSHLAEAVEDSGATVRVPTMLLWFIGDFGGPRGVRRFLAEHGVEAEGRKVRFLRYDWSPAPGNWSPDA